MIINKVSPTNFTSGIKVFSKDNSGRQYLYNEALDITREQKLPAVFTNSGILFSRVTDSLVKKLEELNIKFSEV